MDTNSYDRHLRIQEFKRAGTALVDGINFANVVATLLYDSGVKGWLKRVAHALLMGARVTSDSSATARHIVLYSARGKLRADYDYIVDRLMSIMAGKARLVEVRDSFSLLQPFRTLAGLMPAWPLVRGYKGTVMERLLCALLVSRARSALLPIAARELKGVETLVTFCDAHPIENLATQMANSKGVFTITNQHGQYRVLDHTNMSADAEAYANFQSDRMLAWGGATVREFEKAGIATSRLSVTGWIRLPRTAKVRATAAQPCFGVMFNGENGRESNANLLRAADKIAESLGLEYVVRLHPWSRAADYAGMVSARCVGLFHLSLEQYLCRVRFSLGHMSGAVVEVLDHGAPVYLLDDGCLASVFRLEGLSWPDADAILNVVEQDLNDPQAMIVRIEGLARWFNDAERQVDRLASALGLKDAAPSGIREVE
ncbi:hypothetical protein ERT44_17910 [Stenotrophomonas sp. MA5]|uniref:hypothetical protein n=1 Tax=Stenotrophomonas sp. MA5 TaxID=2508572 RepID=UPI001009BBFC|nr:hypothetical protein [Stenotrophomonas sp. MA5]RXK63766.1 hypothetical protein ERT44_17910 [Stenotrophomonas sp. MA5]